jgi:hypothetical protein
MTTGSGLVTMFKTVPLSEIATLVGIVLSCVLIYTHWRKGRADYEKAQLEIELLKRKVNTTEEAG